MGVAREAVREIRVLTSNNGGYDESEHSIASGLILFYTARSCHAMVFPRSNHRRETDLLSGHGNCFFYLVTVASVEQVQ